ncbi:MAG: hypothetical protein KC416_12965 [Myxococcales bacterium]|nr:hypothetical protein [Myxococcales bacterium]
MGSSPDHLGSDTRLSEVTKDLLWGRHAFPKGWSVVVEGASAGDGSGYRLQARPTRGRLVLTRAPARGRGILLVVLSLVWLLIVLAGAGAALAAGRAGFLFVTVPHLVMALGLGYWGLTSLFNRTRIIVDDDALRVVKGPLPVGLGEATFPLAEIGTVYSDETFFRVNGRRTYALRLKTSVGQRVTLVRCIPARFHGITLAKVLREFAAP